MKINKSIIFFRSKDTGKVLCPIAVYPEGTEPASFDQPSIWHTTPLTCGTPEARQVFNELYSAWNEDDNKRFRLPVILEGAFPVTYEEVETMLFQFYHLMKMTDEEAMEYYEHDDEDKIE